MSSVYIYFTADIRPRPKTHYQITAAHNLDDNTHAVTARDLTLTDEAVFYHKAHHKTKEIQGLVYEWIQEALVACLNRADKSTQSKPNTWIGA